MLAVFLTELVQLVFKIRLDIFAAFGKTWQLETPEVDARQEVQTELVIAHIIHQIAVSAADEKKIAVLVACCTERTKGFFLDGLQEHRLSFKGQFADFIEEDNAAVGFLEISRMIAVGTRE